MTGATDAQFYQPVCKSCIRFAPVIYGPEQMKGMHGLNGNIEYNCLPGAVSFYKNLIRAQEEALIYRKNAAAVWQSIFLHFYSIAP